MPLLTGPVHQLTDFQIEYDGLLLGEGTPYELPPTWTFLDAAPVKTMETVRPWGDGSWAGPDFADVQTWQLPVEIAADAGVSFVDAIAAFRSTITISRTSRPLWVKLPGMPVQGLGARVAQRSLPIDLGYGSFVAGAVQWRSVRPVWQSIARAVTLLPFTNGGGLDFPMFATYGGSTGALDFGITAPAPYSTVLTNAGNTDAPPLASVAGPTSAFQLAVNGHLVTYSGALTASDVVTVDWSTGRAYLSSSGSAPVDRTYLLSDRDFAGVVPAGGNATVTFTADGGSAAITTADLWR